MAKTSGRAADRPRVLLIWPGGLFSGGSNFGVPQLLSIAGALQSQADAFVKVLDLDMESAFGQVDLSQLCDDEYLVVGISCYSSYDYLKVMVIGQALRQLMPDAVFVTGGYHPSARPTDFTGPDSPFDYVVVGDGELPLVGLSRALAAGNRPTERILGPDPLPDPNTLPPYDWTLLERYRPVARQLASQAEIYLSRGCPHGCAFCMERSKRETSWRPLEPERAFEELERFDHFLDLSRWTLFVSDAAFGLQTPWRRSLLEQLARKPLRARKVWLLTRIDRLEREDLELMARANVAPGFGLESGDAQQLRRMNKAPHPEAYLDHAKKVARWANELSVPFGANIIVGHPGESETTLRRTAEYMTSLFLDDPPGTHGFLSVDPYRLYPGSPVDEKLEQWQRDTGMTAHRYPWWHDGDQDFLAEWIDPSASLDFRTTLRLRRELFDPIVKQIAERFAYRGPARSYFIRAVDEQIELTAPQRYLHTLGMWHLWRRLTAQCGDEMAARADDTVSANTAQQDLELDDELAEVARQARLVTLTESKLETSTAMRSALERVPRERFVAPEFIGESAADKALPLSSDDKSTLSAMHAYVAAFHALALHTGDHLVELGGGSGYGAALASEVVGATGRVLSIELHRELAAAARRHLAAYPQAEVLTADAHETTAWQGMNKVYVAFALERLDESWLEALGTPGRLVAPLGNEQGQTLTLIEKTSTGIERTELGPVRYVLDRSAAGS